MSPYFYVIQHKSSSKIYIGSQYGKNADKKNFWVSYFTSSRVIKDLILKEGKDSFHILKIKESKFARKIESKFLQQQYRILSRELFLSKFFNRNISPGIVNDEDSLKRSTETKRKRWRDGSIQKPTPPNLSGRPKSTEMREKLSSSLQGHEVSDSTKEKIKNTLSGKMIWITDRQNNLFVEKDSIFPPNFKRGRTCKKK